MQKNIFINFRSTLFDSRRCKPTPASSHVLYTLKRRGYSTVIITDTDEQSELLDQFGLTQYVTKVTCKKPTATMHDIAVCGSTTTKNIYVQRAEQPPITITRIRDLLKIVP